MINQDLRDYDLPEATLLGKIVSAPTQYDPSILVAIPRDQNRKQYNITGEEFTGNDLWRCYECSTLTRNGMPVYFSMVIQYRSYSPNIVESKSLKLYLNSFNNTKSPFVSKKETIQAFISNVSTDLEKLLGIKPTVYIEDGYSSENFKEYINLESIVEYSAISTEDYSKNSDLLKTSALKSHRNVQYLFEGFRSNCKITNQPDYANIYLEIRTDNGIDPVSLVKYLSSFRNENHFHEECCEMIYKDILEKINPLYLSVSCCYTRRGGIDITPTRSSKKIEETNFEYMISPERSRYQ